MSYYDSERRIELGVKYPYGGKAPTDWAERAAQGVLADLADRGGIKHELAGVDEAIRTEIAEALSRIIRVAADTREPVHGEGVRVHPEDSCQQCGGPNVVWFAPNLIWNAVAPGDGIVCPVCFIKAAEAKGFNKAAWQIAPEGHEAAVEGGFIK